MFAVGYKDNLRCINKMYFLIGKIIIGYLLAKYYLMPVG